MDMNKSLSDSETYQAEPDYASPPDFISKRIKRKRSNEPSYLISELREEMKKMLNDVIKSQKQRFDSNDVTLKQIKETNANIENSLAFVTTQNEELKKKIELLENKAIEDRKYIAILEDKIEHMQQDSRKSNFEIKNVPTRPNESKSDLLDLVTCLSNTIGCEIQKSDIKDIYRVRGKNESTKNTPIVVETSSTLLKNEVLKMSKAYNIKHKTKLRAQHLGFRTSEDTPIFINDHLTAKGARLHFLARDLIKHKLYKYCWTAYGKVYLRKNDDSRVILIRSESQIQGILQTI